MQQKQSFQKDWIKRSVVPHEKKEKLCHMLRLPTWHPLLKIWYSFLSFFFFAPKCCFTPTRLKHVSPTYFLHTVVRWQLDKSFTEWRIVFLTFPMNHSFFFSWHFRFHPCDSECQEGRLFSSVLRHRLGWLRIASQCEAGNQNSPFAEAFMLLRGFCILLCKQLQTSIVSFFLFFMILWNRPI